jgi:hypothetical protein
MLVSLFGCGDDERRSSVGGSAEVSDGGVSDDDPLSPVMAANPWLAANGFGTQHGDSAASDSSPYAGPGSETVAVQRVDVLAACPSLLMTKGELLLAVCTQIFNRAPTVYLFAPGGSAPLDTLELSAGSLFGGVYPYLDHDDRLVIIDGTNQMLHVEVKSKADGPRLEIVDSLDLSASIPSDCAGPGCNGVVGLIPDYEGRIWFATDGALTGFVDRERNEIKTLALSPGERVANSIASGPAGVAVVSDQALYLLRVDHGGAPVIVFRASYDRGNARKPGQLSQGSGSTPTFIASASGSAYVVILDNAQPEMNLLIYEAREGGALACSLALPAPTGDGSESSPIGVGRSVIVSSSYGYPYATSLPGTGPTVPESAPLAGGLTRVDFDDRSGECSLVWSNTVRSSAVPKLSLADRSIYTFERTPASAEGVAGPLDSYAYTSIDADTGAIVFRQELPDVPDTMQLAGTIAADGSYYQGTMLGFLRITR